jgi:hypothetical protein
MPSSLQLQNTAYHTVALCFIHGRAKMVQLRTFFEQRFHNDPNVSLRITPISTYSSMRTIMKLSSLPGPVKIPQNDSIQALSSARVALSSGQANDSLQALASLFHSHIQDSLQALSSNAWFCYKAYALGTLCSVIDLRQRHRVAIFNGHANESLQTLRQTDSFSFGVPQTPPSTLCLRLA